LTYIKYFINEKNYIKDAVLQDLKAMERYIIDAVNDAGYDGTMEYSREFRHNIIQCFYQIFFL
jgi:hypothetical protein